MAAPLLPVLLTPTAAARVIGWSLPTLLKRVDGGDGPPVVLLADGRRRFDADELRRWAIERAETSARSA